MIFSWIQSVPEFVWIWDGGSPSRNNSWLVDPRRPFIAKTLSPITRLISGIFRIFDPREWNLNLNSSDCRASKIIWNDTKLGPISWELNIEYPTFNFCVGVWVGGHHRANFLHRSKDALENFKSFHTHDIPAPGREKTLTRKTGQKYNFTKVKFALVEAKSNKYPLLYILKWPA